MRIAPDGLQLLRAARPVVAALTERHDAADRVELLSPIAHALALGEELLVRDAAPSAAELSVLEDARVAMRGRVLDALPPHRQFDARLVAKAIAIAIRQLVHGSALERREYERLITLLDASGAPHGDDREIAPALAALNKELCRRIRAGEADTGTDAHIAIRQHLEITNHEALSASDPISRPPVVGHAVSGAASKDDDSRSSMTAAASAWGTMTKAIMSAVVDSSSAAAFNRNETMQRLRGVVGDAAYTSGGTMISAQATVLGWAARRAAANANVPMLVVEGMRQAHDLSAAVADANMALWRLALVPLRGTRPANSPSTGRP